MADENINIDINHEAEEVPLAFSNPDDPRRMELTPEERDWALDIKDVIEMYPELDNLSDFMYANLALVVQDDVADAVRRAMQLQAFREEYGLKDTLSEQKRVLADYVRQNPSICYDYSFDPGQGRYVLVQDIAAFDKSGASTTKQVDDFAIGGYYLLHSQFPDLEATRHGFTVLMECEGFSLSRNKHMWNLMQKFNTEVLSAYPVAKGGEVRHLNAPTMFNVMASTIRKLLPDQLRDKYCRGPSYSFESSLEGGRLDALYLTPTVEIAVERAVKSLQHSLDRRHRNEINFLLTVPEDDNEVILDSIISG